MRIIRRFNHFLFFWGNRITRSFCIRHIRFGICLFYMPTVYRSKSPGFQQILLNYGRLPAEGTGAILLEPHPVTRWIAAVIKRFKEIFAFKERTSRSVLLSHAEFRVEAIYSTRLICCFIYNNESTGSIFANSHFKRTVWFLLDFLSVPILNVESYNIFGERVRRKYTAFKQDIKHALFGIIIVLILIWEAFHLNL